ncbi:hypothetical protein BIW11_05600 [Tropilaelaps mercedesae]|uniref:Uncharacterized protein n=1 Tax=Tropilaelaps mercedesae TaxID=418985 RepID=A0A1V9Y1J4_9ACAR|nr:hypothetical protein BIW11_05600 [Tropilaelaps mercedesae]
MVQSSIVSRDMEQICGKQEEESGSECVLSRLSKKLLLIEAVNSSPRSGNSTSEKRLLSRIGPRVALPWCFGGVGCVAVGGVSARGAEMRDMTMPA